MEFPAAGLKCVLRVLHESDLAASAAATSIARRSLCPSLHERTQSANKSQRENCCRTELLDIVTGTRTCTCLLHNVQRRTRNCGTASSGRAAATRHRQLRQERACRLCSKIWTANQLGIGPEIRGVSCGCTSFAAVQSMLRLRKDSTKPVRVCVQVSLPSSGWRCACLKLSDRTLGLDSRIAGSASPCWFWPAILLHVRTGTGCTQSTSCVALLAPLF